MKFKYLIIAFSVVIVIILLITAMFPLLIAELGLGAGLRNGESSPLTFALNFRYITLPLLIFTVLLLGSLGIFFFFNYRLFSLLEREDWPALAYYLEQKIFVKGRYNTRNVRLLASSYLVISDYQSVLKLESKAQLAKPSVIGKNVLIFGAARVLSGKHTEATAFFKTYLDKGNVKSKAGQWVRWYYGFSQLLSGAFTAVKPEFSSLIDSSNDVFITGLSAYFLQSSISKYCENPDECIAAAKKGKERVISALKSIEGWKKEADKMGTEIHIAIIKKYIDEAGVWVFDGDVTP